MPDQNLKEQLEWLQTSIEAWDFSDQRIEKVIKPNSRLTASERLEIYCRDYFLRLRDTLRSDYTTLAWILGDKTWHSVAIDYIRAYPSRHPNIHYFGRDFPTFISQSDLPNKDILAELANLQCTVASLFELPELAPITSQTLENLKPEDWEHARFIFQPTLKLHAFKYPVNRFLRAYNHDENPSWPLKPEASWVQVYRSQGRTWRLGISHARFEVLRNLMAGSTLTQALETAQKQSDVSEHDFASQVQKWFQNWMAEGLFCGIEVPS